MSSFAFSIYFIVPSSKVTALASCTVPLVRLTLPKMDGVKWDPSIRKTKRDPLFAKLSRETLISTFSNHLRFWSKRFTSFVRAFFSVGFCFPEIVLVSPAYVFEAC